MPATPGSPAGRPASSTEKPASLGEQIHREMQGSRRSVSTKDLAERLGTSERRVKLAVLKDRTHADLGLRGREAARYQLVDDGGQSFVIRPIRGGSESSTAGRRPGVNREQQQVRAVRAEPGRGTSPTDMPIGMPTKRSEGPAPERTPSLPVSPDGATAGGGHAKHGGNGGGQAGQTGLPGARASGTPDGIAQESPGPPPLPARAPGRQRYRKRCCR